MKPELIKKIRRIITHANCADGILAAAICRQALPLAAIEFRYHDETLEVTEGMLFVDITPPTRYVSECQERGAIVLDHHKAQEALVARFGERGRFACETLEPGVSGALLAYQEVYVPLLGENPRAEALARLIGVRDTWQRQDPTWERACRYAAAIVFLGDEFLLNSSLMYGPEVIGHRILEDKNKFVEKIVENGLVYRDYQDYKVALFYDNRAYVSEVAEAAKDKADLIVGCFYVKDATMNDDEIRLVFSLRSGHRGKTRIDVGALAKELGGGGHTFAAGFSITRGTFGDEPSMNPFETFMHLIDGIQLRGA